MRLSTWRSGCSRSATPTSYAARFAPDLRRRSRLTAAFFAALAALSTLPLVDEPDWSSAAVVALLAWLAWREHRSSRREHGRVRTSTREPDRARA